MKISLGLVFVLILLQACSLTDVTSFFWDSDKENTNIPELNQDRQDWKDKLSWPPECNQDEANFYNEESGVKVYNLSENKSIVLVSCFLGSYQDNYRLYLYTEGQDQPVKNLVLESKTQKDSQDPKRVDLDSFSSTETYENFVETGREMWVVSKDAGHGACGTAAKYIWNDEIEEYNLILMRGHFDCENARPYENWPVIFER